LLEKSRHETEVAIVFCVTYRNVGQGLILSIRNLLDVVVSNCWDLMSDRSSRPHTSKRH